MSKKMTPPFFGSKIMNLLVFFDFEPKKCFRVPTPWGLYEAEWDERLQFMHFLAIFAMLAVLATLVTRGTHFEGCEWGCCDSICLLGYGRAFFAVSSLPCGRSQPVPKTRNDYFHQ